MSGIRAGRTVRVWVVPGEPRPVWCDGCLTSAAVEVDLYTLIGDGGPYHVGTLTFCARCDDPVEAVALAAGEIQRAVNDG